MFKWLRERTKEFLTVLRLLRKGGEKGMAQLLALNIMMAEMAFADVPKMFRKAVRKQLKILGAAELEFMTLEQLKQRLEELEQGEQ